MSLPKPLDTGCASDPSGFFCSCSIVNVVNINPLRSLANSRLLSIQPCYFAYMKTSFRGFGSQPPDQLGGHALLGGKLAHEDSRGHSASLLMSQGFSQRDQLGSGRPSQQHNILLSQQLSQPLASQVCELMQRSCGHHNLNQELNCIYGSITAQSQLKLS